MMTCLETDAALPRFVAAGLEKQEREELQQHLAVCSGCRERAAGLRQAALTIRQSVATAEDPSPADVPAALVRAIVAVVATGSAAASGWQQA